MKDEILVTLNEKGFATPVFLEAVHFLREQADYVVFPGAAPSEVDPQRIAAARLWVVAGGDGTVNGVVNALLRLPKEKRPPVCYLPSGTGNDFARTLGLDAGDPLEHLKAAFSRKEAFRPVAVGRCNDHYFLNMASGGIFATVTPEVNRQLKSIAGRWSYFLEGIGKMMERESFSLRVNGGEAFPVLGFFVGNARFAGGGIQVVSEADPFSSELEFLVVPDMTTKDLLALGLELQKEEPDISAFPARLESVRELDLAFRSPVPINLDGEQVQVSQAKFSVFPGAVRLYVPEGARN